MRPFIPSTAGHLGAGALLATVLATGCVPDASRSERMDEVLLRLVEAEDARPTDGRDLALLVEASGHGTAEFRRVAIRALGRLENPALVEHIRPHLSDPAPAVRATAANAIAQASRATPGSAALATLMDRLPIEANAVVLGALARSIGRLDLEPVERVRAARVLVDMSRQPDGTDAPPATLMGVALGLESLVRGGQGQGIEGRTGRRLIELTRVAAPSSDDIDAARVRGLALAALGQARRIDRALIDGALRDPDPQVAAIALRFLPSVPPEQGETLLARAVEHPSTLALVEAYRFMEQTPRTAATCTHLFSAAASTTGQAARAVPAPARVIAMDALALPCPEVDTQRALLREAAAALPAGIDGLWQPSSHALVSLARLASEDASALLALHAEHVSPFVRAHAARAARLTGDSSTLRLLVRDDHPNVRTAAIEGIFALEGHEVDDVLLIQLEGDDPQLLMTAARLLEGSPRPADVGARALAAFERISEAERETWRDARRALLAAVVAVGDETLAERLTPYLLDYDPLVAADVAEALEKWTGRPHLATVVPLPRLSLPTVADLRAMDGASVVLHMRGGGVIEIRLHPYLAPNNAFRFYRLAREGYFDGLTFHRWVPNFVIQGGSPGANEYEGDGPFTRDEVGLLSHWRGTVGISTRGHDTGDGQIFVNLVDNVRLDHAYTVVGTVVRGMDVVDGVLEGAVIERAEIVEGG
jgi:cyclophilin family peptidyl-prolyl cis-trans isomerase/HEAT repeat protein